jgi:hypothetical protein
MIRNLWNKLTGSDIRNSGTAMSWSDLFAKVGREKRYSGYDETKIGLSALYCGLQMYTSQISTLSSQCPASRRRGQPDAECKRGRAPRCQDLPSFSRH